MTNCILHFHASLQLSGSGTCQFLEISVLLVWHCLSLLMRSALMRTGRSLFREGQKTTHGLWLHGYHKMQEPKYQLEQETIPIPFLFGTYNGTGKVLCALTIYNLPTENRWMTQICWVINMSSVPKKSQSSNWN